MADRREKRSRLGRAFEIALYAVAVSVPLLYFARQYPPVEAWLGRIELRNPIVVDHGNADDGSIDGASSAENTPRSQTVYRCLNDGELVLSDQPCGNIIETREIGPGDVNILPSEAFTGHPAAPGNVDCGTLERRLAELDEQRRRSSQDDSSTARERDAVWQQGRAARCW